MTQHVRAFRASLAPPPPSMVQTRDIHRGTTRALQRRNMSAHTPRRRVLLVDDEARSARLLAKLLREDGYDVELVFDGAAAVGRLSREPLPDILVTDFRMPHVDGLAVARYARARKPGIPVVFTTGYPQMLSAAGSGLLPAAEIYTKPLDYAQLADDLRAAIR